VVVVVNFGIVVQLVLTTLQKHKQTRMSLAKALHEQDSEFNDLKKIDGQQGVAVLDYEGRIVTSSGKLENDKSTLSNIFFMLQDVRGILTSNNNNGAVNNNNNSGTNDDNMSSSPVIPSLSSSVITPPVENTFHKMEIRFETVVYIVTMTTSHILIVLKQVNEAVEEEENDHHTQ
jgi:hypothetical protein